MKVFSVVVILGCFLLECSSAPPNETAVSLTDDGKIELFDGVIVERDPAGADTLNVKFQPGELEEAARSFEEARGKLKKYAPLVAGLSVKALAIIGVVFGAITLLVTKAIFVAKVAFLAAAAVWLQRWLSSGGSLPYFGKVPTEFNPWTSSQPQWSAAASTGAGASPYPYARSATDHDSNDLAYNAQIPTQDR